MPCVASAKQGVSRHARKRLVHVYLLRSTVDPTKRYVGLTSDLKKRLGQHISGSSPYTSRFGPWELVVAVYFTDRRRAEAFERYLKHGSGHAFANRYFW